MVLQEWPPKRSKLPTGYFLQIAILILAVPQGELDLEEDDELNAQTQTGAKAKKAKGQEKEAPAQVLHGRKGFELYLKCIQLILRKQVWVLVHEKGFPVQLEVCFVVIF